MPPGKQAIDDWVSDVFGSSQHSIKSPEQTSKRQCHSRMECARRSKRQTVRWSDAPWFEIEERKKQMLTTVKSVMGQRARMARAIAGQDDFIVRRRPRRELTSNEKKLARHLAHDGLSYDEIAQRLNWPLGIFSLRKKLNAINIRPHRESMSDYQQQQQKEFLTIIGFLPKKRLYFAL